MASVTVRKAHLTYKHSTNQSHSCDTNNISFDTSHASNDTNSYETISSSSSIASTTTIERSPKYRHQILQSTLKFKNKDDHSHMSFKRRSHFKKLFHHTKIIHRHYMMTMTNILFQTQRELYKLKRRTNRIEQVVIKQAKNAQPIIRIPRLTKDQLSTICIEDNENIIQQNEAISDDNNNNEIPIITDTKSKTTKSLNKYKRSKVFTKKRRPYIWENNRQKPIDLNRYCSICQHEFSRRSNFLIHVRNIHKGKFPPNLTEQDQSLSEMNEENFHKNPENLQNETTNDQSVIIISDDIEPLQTMTNQWDFIEGRLRPRTTTKSTVTYEKIKCNICNKFYRADYMKKHKTRAHPDQEIVSLSNEINNNSDQMSSISDKQIEEYHLSNENSSSINKLDIQNASTPTTITIAEIDIDDVPIRFRSDSTRTIVIAVTCLESYQLELVEKFVEKFSSIVCQTTSIDSRTTHLITNDEQHALRSPLSMKLIEAIAHHCYCVSYRWIIDCLKHERIIDEESYEIEGDDTEIHPHGGPRRSRLIPNRHTLFQNICFMIKCTENSDIRMTNDRLEDLITTCGGQIITCVTQRLLDKYQIIVLCDMLYVSERRHNYDQCRSLGIHFVSSDWVLESILEYRRKPFQLFEEVPL